MLPEIQECLKEAGFRYVDVYMQGWDEEKDEETERFYKVTKCDADPAWVAYLIARKQIDKFNVIPIIPMRVSYTVAM